MGFNKCLKYAGIYHFYLSLQSWHTAKDRCAAKGGKLATVRCAEEAKIVGDLYVSTGMISFIQCTAQLKDGVNTFFETFLPKSEHSRSLNLIKLSSCAVDYRNTVKY
jgi:hypothetical protein